MNSEAPNGRSVGLVQDRLGNSGKRKGGRVHLITCESKPGGRDTLLVSSIPAMEELIANHRQLQSKGQM